MGQHGWNCFHFAIFCQHLEIVKYLLNINKTDGSTIVDINQSTIDHWTPLQLAIRKGGEQVIQLLLSIPTLDLHKLTGKGSALHLASKAENRAVTTYLLEQGVDPHLKDEYGYQAIDVTRSKVIT